MSPKGKIEVLGAGVLQRRIHFLPLLALGGCLHGLARGPFLHLQSVSFPVSCHIMPLPPVL